MAQVRVSKAEAFNKQTNKLKKGYKALGGGQYVKITKSATKTKAKTTSKVGRRRNRR